MKEPFGAPAAAQISRTVDVWYPNRNITLRPALRMSSRSEGLLSASPPAALRRRQHQRELPAVPSDSDKGVRLGPLRIVPAKTLLDVERVHNPAMRRMPAAIERTATIVTFKGGSIHSLESARTTNVEPTTKRMKSKPVPGQPPANVEYSRRTLYTPIF